MKINTTQIYLLLVLLLAACELENPEVGINLDDVITVAAKDGLSSILADSTQEVQIIATLGSQAAANESITFSTEDGRFAEATAATPNTYTVNASGKTAVATLVSSTTVGEAVVVSAKVGDFINTTTIEFTRALPTDFTIDLDPPIVTAGANASTTVTIDLFRDNQQSKPSDNTKISFNLMPLDTATAEVPAFVFSNNSQATASIKSTNGLPGKLELNVTVEGLPSRTLGITFQ